MAIEKVVKIVGDTSDADKKVNKLTDDVEKLGKETEKTNNTTQKGLENTTKSTKKATKSVKVLSGTFRLLGNAIKAAGIGLVISIVAGLTTAFSKNQRVVNAVSTSFETASIVFSEVAAALFNVYDSVSKSSENFNALGKVLKGLLTIAITPLKIGFFGIKLAIQQGQLAWEQSFFGGKDKKKIAELQIGILETKNAIIETGKEAFKSGKDIVNNFGEAIEETSNIAKKTVEEVSKISVKSAFETAKANVQIRNTAKLAVAQQQLLVEKYDILAEKQRQIRDEERNSIDERIIANNKLGKVLEMQEKAMLRTADAQIISAQIELKKNNNIENQVALTEALANKQGVLAQIEGFRSEQLVNDLALKREQIELDNTIADSEKERRLKQLEFEASQEENSLIRLDKQRERLELENEIIQQDLERKRELFKEGTLARVEAEQEYLNKKQDIDNAILENERKKSDEETKLAQDVAKAKENIANRGLALIIELAGRGSKIGKAIAVAQTIRSGIEGVQNAYSTAQKSPITALFPAYPAIQAGLAGAFSALQVKKILATSDIGGSASGGNQQPSAPSFNLVQGTGSNQVAETISQDNKPIEAFVVGSNVTSQQELDRQRTANSSI